MEALAFRYLSKYIFISEEIDEVEAMDKLVLVRPSMKYAEQVMVYKEAMARNGDSFDGCAGLEEVTSFSEWIDFENRLKR